MSTRTVSVELQAKVGQYTSSMDKAAKVTAQTDTAVQRASKSTGVMSQRMAVAGGVAAGALVFGLKQALTAASDLNETTSKVGVIFGDSAAEIDAWAETADTALGQSKKQAMDAASTFAVFGKSAGLAGEDLSGFSTEMVQLSSDLASFYNTSPEEAIQAIGAAMRGEQEPIRRYGVLIDDASLRQEALAQGLIKTTKEALTPQQKVLASQALILKQTTDAQGDFARTSDGAANQQRILTAQLENTKAELGQGMLPILQDVLGGVNDLVGAFNDLPAPVQRSVLLIAAVGTVALVAAPRLLALKQLLASSGDGAGRFSGGLKSAASVLGGPWGLAITGGVAALGMYAAKNAESKQRVEELTAAIEADSGAMGENTRAKVVNALESDGTLKAARELGLSLSDVTSAALGDAAAQKRVAAATEQSRISYERKIAAKTKGTVTLTDEEKATRKVTEAIRGEASASREAVEAAQRKSAALRDDARAARFAKRSIQELNAEIRTLNALLAGATSGSAASARIIEERDLAGRAAAGRATGGQLVAGRRYVIGERGPETLTLGAGGLTGSVLASIRPAAPVSKSIAFAPVIHINGTSLGLAEVRREVDGALHDFVRQMEAE